MTCGRVQIVGFTVLYAHVVNYEIAGKYWYSSLPLPMWVSHGISRINGTSCISDESSYNSVSQTVGRGLLSVLKPFFAHKVLELVLFL